MGLTRAAIIVIVLVACLAVTALGAALFKRYNPDEDEGRYNTSYEQSQYMREVRMRNYGHLHAESAGRPRDLESCYTAEESGYYPPPPPHPHPHPPYPAESNATTPL